MEGITETVKLKTSMVKSSLCDYSNADIRVKGAITIPNSGTAAGPYIRNKQVLFKNYAAFTDCISEITNTQVDNTKDIDVVIPMYNLIESK